MKSRYSIKSVIMPFTIPYSFFCPITKECLQDPYIASDGFTYEKTAIQAWLSREHPISPMTGLLLDARIPLIANRALKNAIEEFNLNIAQQSAMQDKITSLQFAIQWRERKEQLRQHTQADPQSHVVPLNDSAAVLLDDESTQKALVRAVKENNILKVNELLRMGVNIDCPLIQERPLLCAITLCESTIFEICLSHGADIFIRNTGSASIIEQIGLLSSWQPDIKREIFYGLSQHKPFSPVLQAACLGDEEVLFPILESSEGLDQLAILEDSVGNTVLHYAAANGHVNLCQKLISYIPSFVKQKNGKGNAPFLMAAWRGQVGVMQLLLERGVLLGEGSFSGTTALLWSAQNNKCEAVSWLLSKGISLSEKNKDGHTVLLRVALFGKLEMLVWLLSQGASLSDRTKEGNTILLCASFKGQAGIVEWLLSENKSDIHEMNIAREKAIDLASTDEVKDILRHFSQRSELLKRFGVFRPLLPPVEPDALNKVTGLVMSYL